MCRGMETTQLVCVLSYAFSADNALCLTLVAEALTFCVSTGKAELACLRTRTTSSVGQPVLLHHEPTRGLVLVTADAPTGDYAPFHTLPPGARTLPSRSDWLVLAQHLHARVVLLLGIDYHDGALRGACSRSHAALAPPMGAVYATGESCRAGQFSA